MIKWIRFLVLFVEFILSTPLDVITGPSEAFEDMSALLRAGQGDDWAGESMEV